MKRQFKTLMLKRLAGNIPGTLLTSQGIFLSFFLLFCKRSSLRDLVIEKSAYICRKSTIADLLLLEEKGTHFTVLSVYSLFSL